MTLATARKSTRNTAAKSRSGVSSRRTSARSPLKPAEHMILRMYRNPIGKVFLVLAVAVVIIGIDFLVTLNHFERFFIVIGIEWIIVTLVGWVLFVFRERLKSGN